MVLIVMRRQYKASLNSYVGLGIGALGFSAVLLSPLFIECPPPKPHDVWLASAISIGLPVFTFWWLSRFRLTITPTELSYTSAFTSERTINLAEVCSARMIHTGRRGAPGMKLFEVRSTDGTSVRIHYNLFSDEACEDLFKLAMPATARDRPKTVSKEPNWN